MCQKLPSDYDGPCDQPLDTNRLIHQCVDDMARQLGAAMLIETRVYTRPIQVHRRSTMIFCIATIDRV